MSVSVFDWGAGASAEIRTWRAGLQEIVKVVRAIAPSVWCHVCSWWRVEDSRGKFVEKEMMYEREIFKFRGATLCWSLIFMSGSQGLQGFEHGGVHKTISLSA